MIKSLTDTKKTAKNNWWPDSYCVIYSDITFLNELSIFIFIILKNLSAAVPDKDMSLNAEFKDSPFTRDTSEMITIQRHSDDFDIADHLQVFRLTYLLIT